MNVPRFAPSRLAALGLALLLAGCADMGHIHPEAKLLPAATLNAGHTIQSASPMAWPTDTWWQALGDAQLNKLVDAAIADNPTLKVAQARVRLAQSLSGVAKAATQPHVNAAASVDRQRFSDQGTAPPPIAGTWRWLSDAQVSVAYDLDLWGRDHDLLAAALNDTQVASAEAQAARLALETAVVRSYIQLWYEHELLDSVRASLAQRERILDITRRRQRAGLATAIDVATVDLTLPAGRREQERLEEAVALRRHQLAALTGKGPGDGETIARPQLVLRAAVGLPSTVPADLVGRRPDIAAQRWRVEAAGHGIQAAKAAFYPNINIAAFAGLQSFGFSKFLSASSSVRGVTPALSLPIFDGGRLRGQLGGQTALYDAAVEQYNATLIQALLEVANTVTQMESVEGQRHLAEQALDAARNAHALADKSYRAGLTDTLAVLSTRLTLLNEEDQARRVEMERLDNYVNLMAALGGGLQLPTP
ncbi:efflux transporter outer membrane subunit [Pseudoduganella sp. FT26W]|uniref:Efflux transporter outer membrane subunit n=1 Tax=Duganella aquatilis TaxID=2666082 RepID=A0A844D3G1_9BURK|nr:efflux transporter outer membrane subunit [Duganella aquatilis]MRW84315.1 efflux transporter outer membrane subunit [Duganella aquatilis]